MSNVDAFFLGLMVAWTPSLIAIVVLLWRAPVIEDEPRRPTTPRNDIAWWP